MKKKLLMLTAVFALASSITAFADSYARLESDYGNIDILGCETYSNDDGDFVFVFAQFENTTDESSYTDDYLYMQVFQDGLELDHGYVYSGEYAPEGYHEYDTKVRPGASILYYNTFELSNTTDPIEIEISEFMSGNKEECVLDLDGEVVENEEAEYTADEASVSRLAQLEEKIAELEERIEALENR